MTKREEAEQIYCHSCGRWINARLNTFLDDDNVYSLCCEAHLGYSWDWEEVFGGGEE